MKILILEGDIFNGITGFRKDLVNELKKENDVYLAGSIAYEWQRKGDFINNEKIISLGKLQNSFFGLFIYQFRLLFLLVKISPDVCLSFNMRPNLVLGIISILKKMKCAATITGTGFLFENNNFKVKLLKKIYKFSLSRFNLVFVQNKSDFDSMIENGFKFKNSTVIPGSGVDTERFIPTVINFNESGMAKFIFVSRIIREKGFFEYVEAAKRIKKDNPEVKFFVLGSFYSNGVENSEINQSTIAELHDQKIIEFIEHKKNVIPYIENVDCVVLPSYREGLSNSLMEAASLSKPIITTNVPGCKELVDHEKSGYLCEVRNSEDLEKKMKLFLGLSKSNRIEMGKAGREKMINFFNRQKVITEYSKFIKSIKLSI